MKFPLYPFKDRGSKISIFYLVHSIVFALRISKFLWHIENGKLIALYNLSTIFDSRKFIQSETKPTLVSSFLFFSFYNDMNKDIRFGRETAVKIHCRLGQPLN